MIDFMFIGLPRSGTAWAANWLTTLGGICHHDPLTQLHYRDWNAKLPVQDRLYTGVSCSGIWEWPSFVNNHPCPKVIIHRDLEDINGSLREIKFQSTMKPHHAEKLLELEGMHVKYQDLFNPVSAERIWNYVIGDALYLDFDVDRHKFLCDMNVSHIVPPSKWNLQVTAELLKETLQ